jgi:hypothetical protein
MERKWNSSPPGKQTAERNDCKRREHSWGEVPDGICRQDQSELGAAAMRGRAIEHRRQVLSMTAVNMRCVMVAVCAELTFYR